MSAINWKSAQSKLGVTADGMPGPVTYASLFAFTAGRKVDDTLRAIGREAATVLPHYGISASAERLAEFLAQTCHESAGYTRFSENMNYSAKRITQVWPSRFPTLALAQPYANNPRALANKVYGGRMGNEANGTADDDGWNNRGGGMLQHTGFAEYALLRSRLGYSSDDVRDPAKSVKAAADFMVRAGTLKFVDNGNYTGARKSVNSGVLGLSEIAAIRNKVLAVLR